MAHKKVYEDDYYTIIERDKDKRYIECADGVMMIPITADGKIIFIREQSVALDAKVLILPGGQLDHGGESPAETANRELQEEIGYKAGQVEAIGQLDPWIKYLKSRVHVFIMRDLTESEKDGDEDSPIETEAVSISEFEALIEAGTLRDSSVIAALYLAKRYLDQQSPEKNPHIM